MVAAIAIIHGAPDGQQNLRAAGQAREVKQVLAIPGVNPGDRLANGGAVGGLAGVAEGLALDHLAIDGICKGQSLGVAHQR